MRTTFARMAACATWNSTTNVSCCAVPYKACEWRSSIALRGIDDAQMLVLLHRDPSLTVPLCVSSDRDEIASAWQTWSDIFSLPQLPEDKACEPGARRRRSNVICSRRPKFLIRRRGGGPLNASNVHRGEREIIARN
jgi:hypothetical protein